MPSFDTPESLFDEFWPGIARAATTSDRLSRLAELLEGCDKFLRSPETRYSVFHQLSYRLSEVPGDAVIWDWLQEKARSADLERQVEMRIAIFELVPDPPINWSHLFRLWDMWFDPRARWAVCAAYFPFPRRVHQHLRRYQAHRHRHGLPLPRLSEEEFRAVLARHAA